jgi:UDP-N-acetylglucosamine diphosphorylase/glucosamine-1-phosphate N-acetyltransferase
MTQLVLTDHNERGHLLPLTHTRPVAKIRIGIWCIDEKWQALGFSNIAFKTQDHLSGLFPTVQHDFNDYIYLNGAILPTESLAAAILGMQIGENWFHENTWLASRSATPLEVLPNEGKQLHLDVKLIDRPWKIFQWNELALRMDFDHIKKNKKSAEVPAGVTLIGNDIFIEEGAELLPCIINTTTGPVYIGKHASIMEGCMVRGGLALLAHSQLKMGAKIYGATTIGPHSKVGGEVNNCVIFGYSNKAHDGFIGNSVIGEWCNLGADTNTSNLKNNYADVKVYNYALKRSESTGSQFCGLTMGDHAKAGINTMFNTGTVCGVFANVFGGDFPHRVIADFAWGGAAGFKQYRFTDAMEVAEKVMQRRGVVLTPELKSAYHWLFENFALTK